MSKLRLAVVAVSMCVGLALVYGPVAVAQTTPDTAASTPKQVHKANRKAASKAARAKKNAELKALEKNGYNPGGDQVNYPENLQDAQRKVDAAKAAQGKPASAP
jgi:hypothetical protein